MAQIIGLPKLSPTMEEGVLVRWVKKKGDKVAPGDLVAEVETDKANMDFNLEDEGVLLELLVAEGETVKLGAPVAILGKAGEDVAALVAEAKGGGGGGKAAKAEPKAEKKPEAKAEAKPAAKAEPKAAPKAEAKPAAKAEAKPAAKAEPKAAPKAESKAAPKAEAKPAAKPAKAEGAKADEGKKSLLASPLAKTLALELGVDLRGVTGSGPGGRIVERDVREAASGGGSAAEPDDAEADAEAETDGDEVERDADGARADGEHDDAEGPVVAEVHDDRPGTAMTVVRGGPLARAGGDEDYEDRPLSGMRKTIASRLTAAKRDVPHFRLQTDVDAGALLDYRQRLNRLLGDRGKISVNDLLIKGAALALRRVPEVNAAFVGDAIRYFTRVHVGVAVALEQGLVTPVVRDADLKGIGVISAEVKDLVDRAKHRQLKAPEIQGSTFTLSNLGMMPIDRFDAIINPPEAAILAIGRIAKQPVVDHDRIVIGERMTLTMSCDHRVVDGALGARFLAALIELVEQPESLAL